MCVVCGVGVCGVWCVVLVCVVCGVWCWCVWCVVLVCVVICDHIGHTSPVINATNKKVVALATKIFLAVTN